MAKLTRRSMFPLAAAGVIAAADGSQGATLDRESVGIVARIAKQRGVWCVLVPDFDVMNGWWLPGMMVPTYWMPISDYLNLLDEVYNMEA